MTWSWLGHFLKPGIIATNALICRSEIKIHAFFSSPTSHDSWLTISSSLFPHLLPALCSPSSSIPPLPFLSLFMSLKLLRTCGGSRKEERILRCVCVFVHVCVCSPISLCHEKLPWLISKSETLNFPTEEATQQPIAAPQFCERSDPLWGSSGLISIPLRLRKKVVSLHSEGRMLFNGDRGQRRNKTIHRLTGRQGTKSLGPLAAQIKCRWMSLRTKLTGSHYDTSTSFSEITPPLN